MGSRKTGLSPPPNILTLTFPRRYSCCGFLLLLVLAVRIVTLMTSLLVKLTSGLRFNTIHRALSHFVYKLVARIDWDLPPQLFKNSLPSCLIGMFLNPGPSCVSLHTVGTELKVTQSALDVHMGCTPFVKD